MSRRDHRHTWYCHVEPMVLVIIVLGLFVLVSLICVTVLILRGVTDKDSGIDQAILLAVYATPMGMALGALGSLLAVQKSNGSQDVNITNPPGDPANVQDLGNGPKEKPMEPTVGAPVLFNRAGHPQTEATIQFVHGPTLVDVEVPSATEEPELFTSVPKKVAGPSPQASSWEWPV